MAISTFNKKQLFRKYILVMISVLVVLSISYVVFENVIASQKYYATLLNKAGKQRYFSQKALSTVARYRKGLISEMRFKNDIREISIAFNESNEYMKAHVNDLLIRNPSDELKFAFSEESKLQTYVDSFVNDLNQFVSRTDRITEMEFQEFSFKVDSMFRYLDETVLEFEKSSQRLTDFAIIKQRSIYLFLFILLCLEMCGVLFPVLKQLRLAANEVEATKRKTRQLLNHVCAELKKPLNGMRYHTNQIASKVSHNGKGCQNLQLYLSAVERIYDSITVLSAPNEFDQLNLTIGESPLITSLSKVVTTFTTDNPTIPINFKTNIEPNNDILFPSMGIVERCMSEMLQAIKPMGFAEQNIMVDVSDSGEERMAKISFIFSKNLFPKEFCFDKFLESKWVSNAKGEKIDIPINWACVLFANSFAILLGSQIKYARKGKDEVEIYFELTSSGKVFTMNSCDLIKADNGSGVPRAIVVDVFSDSLNIVSESLSDMNIQVAVHQDGYQILQYLEQGVLKQQADIVFIRVGVPGLNEHELSKSIRDEYSAKELPIITYSEDANDELIKEAFNSGINIVLSVPFEKCHLNQVIMNSLS